MSGQPVGRFCIASGRLPQKPRFPAEGRLNSLPGNKTSPSPHVRAALLPHGRLMRTIAARQVGERHRHTGNLSPADAFGRALRTGTQATRASQTLSVGRSSQGLKQPEPRKRFLQGTPHRDSGNPSPPRRYWQGAPRTGPGAGPQTLTVFGPWANFSQVAHGPKTRRPPKRVASTPENKK